MHLIKPGTQFDFVGQRKKAVVLSVIMVIASITLFFVKGPNWESTSRVVRSPPQVH